MNIFERLATLGVSVKLTMFADADYWTDEKKGRWSAVRWIPNRGFGETKVGTVECWGDTAEEACERVLHAYREWAEGEAAKAAKEAHARAASYEALKLSLSQAAK